MALRVVSRSHPRKLARAATDPKSRPLQDERSAVGSSPPVPTPQQHQPQQRELSAVPAPFAVPHFPNRKEAQRGWSQGGEQQQLRGRNQTLAHGSEKHSRTPHLLAPSVPHDPAQGKPRLGQTSATPLSIYPRHAVLERQRCQRRGCHEGMSPRPDAPGHL